MGPFGVLARPCSMVLSLAFAIAITRELPAQQHRVVELLVPKKTAASVLDGSLNSADDYTVGPIPSGASSVWFHMKTYRNWGGTTVDEQLQMFINISVPADKVTIELDFDHTDLTATGTRRRIVITKNPSSSMPCANCMTLFNVTSNTSIPVAASSQPLNNPGLPWTLEFQISAAQLDVNTIPALFGMYMEVNTAVTTVFPTRLSTSEPVTSVTDRNTWAHVRSRNAVDFAMLLDRSGSMLATDGTPDSRWTRATRATDVLSAALSFFKEPLIDDRIAVAQYSWDCGNDLSGDRTGALISGGSTSGILITSTPIKLTAGSTPPLPSNCTPIQRGLDFAFNQEVAPPVEDRDRIVVLLSDGLHNMPSAHIPINLSAPTLQQFHDVVQVIAVAMLPDGTGGTLQMDQIADKFRGPPFKARYDNVTGFADLLEVYLKPLENLLAVNFVPATGGTFQPGKADKLVFIGAWNVAANASALAVVNSTGTSGTISTVTDNAIGYSAAIVTTPPATGSWTVSASGPTPPDAVYLIADIQVYAQFFVEQRQHSAGDPIALSVDLREGGHPVLGADVRFSLERPGMGLGDFLSTIQQNCTFAAPAVPPPPRPDSVRARLSRAFGAANAGPPQNPVGDPLPGRYRLAADHFERCGQDLLVRAQDAGIRMHDDGVPPDVQKDDGVYAYAFTAPEEGSYNLRFRVSGNTADGAPFRRTYRLSEFARITPAPEATSQIVQKGGLVNGRQVTHVLLLFQDPLRNYVGPGLADLFKIRVVGAHVLDSLSDLGNGYYRLTLDYAPGGPEPIVSVHMPGSTYEQVIDLSPEPKNAFAFSLHAGVSLPHGTFSNAVDPGFGVTGDLEVRLSHNLTAEALFGFHRFNGVASSADVDLTHFSGGLKAYLIPGPTRLFVSAGGGTYTFDPGATDPGAHAGAGVQFNPSLRIALEAVYTAHTVFTSGSNSTFSSIQAGGRVRF